MLGSCFSPFPCTNTVMNTIAADAIGYIADQLEAEKDVTAKAKGIIRDIAIKHKRIIFNGNNYSDEWVREAESERLTQSERCCQAPSPLSGRRKKHHPVYQARHLHGRGITFPL